MDIFVWMKVVYVPPRNKWPTPSAWDLLLGLLIERVPKRVPSCEPSLGPGS